jgi:hypothetical protein
MVKHLPLRRELRHTLAAGGEEAAGEAMRAVQGGGCSKVIKNEQRVLNTSRPCEQ